jgi:two-component system sensor histidine kinase AtoS
MDLDMVQFSGKLARAEDLISTVVHQLRNPLNNMSMRLELLRSEVGERGLRHVDKLRQEINRLDETLETLVRFVCPPKLNLVAFDIGEVLRQLRTEVENDRIQVELSIDSDLPQIRADREMIHKALANVMANGAEAMPTGGTLSLAAAREDSSVAVTIADSGRGIPLENSRRVFELYYTTKTGGKGMGLPNALRLIELNGGTMMMKSSAGRGTSCSINLPIVSNSLDD